jgi:hypothetical protein
MAGTVTAIQSGRSRPLASDQLLAFPVALLYARHPIEVPLSRVRLILQDGLDPVIVPPLPSRGSQDAPLFEVARDRDQPIIPARKHLED